MTVVGEAGVGKSRLIREFATACTAPAIAPGPPRPLPAVRRRRHVLADRRDRPRGGRISDEDPPDVATRRSSIGCWATAGRPTIREAIVERVAAAISLTPAQFPVAELFWGIRRLLESIAADGRPLVAIVDDIHCRGADVPRLPRPPARGGPGRTDPAADHGPPRALERHGRVGRRTRGDADRPRAAQSTGDADGSSRSCSAGSSPRSAPDRRGGRGQPAVRRADRLDARRDRRHPSRWRGVGRPRRPGELEIPPTVQALIAARLDALPNEERPVIDPASVIGLGVRGRRRRPPRRGRRPRPAVDLDSLTPSSSSGRPSEEEDSTGSAPDDQGHRVRQPPQAHPRRAPRAVRDWAEPVNRERGRELEFEEILGYHLEQAYRYRSELGVIDADDGGRQAAPPSSRPPGGGLGRGDIPGRWPAARRVDLLPAGLDAVSRCSSTSQIPLLSARPARWRVTRRPWSRSGIGECLACSHGLSRGWSRSSSWAGTSFAPLARKPRRWPVLEAYGDEAVARPWRSADYQHPDQAGQYKTPPWVPGDRARPTAGDETPGPLGVASRRCNRLGCTPAGDSGAERADRVKGDRRPRRSFSGRLRSCSP